MTAPAGFAPVFPGWNVWDVYQTSDPGFDVMTLGLSLERQAKIWIEDELNEHAAGAAIADPLNPAALRGDQIEIIPPVTSLETAATRADVPELAGPQQVGPKDSKAIKRTVRFFNRGSVAVLPWPHDADYMLETVYQPSPTNPITSGAAPASLAGAASAVGESVAGAASAVGESVASVGKVAGVLLGVALLGLVLSKWKR